MNPFMQSWMRPNLGLLNGMQPQMMQGMPQGLLGGAMRPPSAAAMPGINLSPGQYGQWGQIGRTPMTMGNTGRTRNG